MLSLNIRYNWFHSLTTLYIITYGDKTKDIYSTVIEFIN